MTKILKDLETLEQFIVPTDNDQVLVVHNYLETFEQLGVKVSPIFHIVLSQFTIGRALSIGWVPFVELYEKLERPEQSHLELVEDFCFIGTQLPAKDFIMGSLTSETEFVKLITNRLTILLEEVLEAAESTGKYAKVIYDKFRDSIDEKVNKFYHEKENYLYKVDLVELVDALIDISYIHYGTICILGQKENYMKNFDIVHNNNMTKFCTDDNVEQTVAHYLSKGINVKAVKNGKYHVVLNELNKIMKPLGYQKVKLDIDLLG